MLISKARFLYYVGEYKKDYEERCLFHEALRPYFDFPVCNYRDGLCSAYESLLTAVSECEDEEGIFEWWVENNPNDSKLITVRDTKTGDETVYDVESAEGLYNYLYDMYHHDD